MESTNDAYEFQILEEPTGKAIQLTKKATAKVDFDDGVYLDIQTTEKPRHL